MLDTDKQMDVKKLRNFTIISH